MNFHGRWILFCSALALAVNFVHASPQDGSADEAQPVSSAEAEASTAKASKSDPAQRVAAASTTSPLIPIKAFALHPKVSMPRLSPDGKYLSVRMDNPDGVHHKLLVYRVKDFSIATEIRMPKYQAPVNVVWVAPDRLVVAKGDLYGSLDTPRGTGEILATDADGKQQNYLFGYATKGRQRGRQSADQAYGVIAGTPDKADGTVYVKAYPWDDENVSLLYRIDSGNGSRDTVAEIDVGGMSFLLDHDGKPRFASGNNNEMDAVAYRHKYDDWVALSDSTYGEYFYPFAYSPNNQTVFAKSSGLTDPLDLVMLNEDGSKQKVLVDDDMFNVGALQWTAAPRQPFGASLAGGIPKTILFQPELRAAKVYRKVQESFAPAFVDFLTATEDGKLRLFSVSSDRDPGTYYLLDTQTLKARKLFAPRSWIEPEQMAERRPIQFTASDGLKLEAILTIPQGKGERNLPMVLMPHGGPHGVSDDWFYDNDAQFLASRGYLVLQVNFRGSGGRGNAFEQAGYRKWGTRIQQDLIDGVRWAIKQKLADPDRICTYGASFGGYSALMSVIRAPDLFQCAIGYAGVYDLAMMFEEGDIADRDAGQYYLKTVLGESEAELDANSPAKLADKIKVPVLLIHGEDDKRAPFEQAEAMRDALKAAGNPPEWLVRDGEGHGFYLVENNIAALTAIQNFLARHIGNVSPHTEPQVDGS